MNVLFVVAGFLFKCFPGATFGASDGFSGRKPSARLLLGLKDDLHSGAPEARDGARGGRGRDRARPNCPP